MVKYVFRSDGPVLVKNPAKADPQKLGEALEKARRETAEGQDMRVTAIENARNRKNALNPHLEWEDPVAAHQFRLIQINQLICSIRVEDVETGEQRPAFISVTPTKGRRHFATPSEVYSSLDLQVAVMRAAEADLEQWRRRYRMLGEICDAIAEAADKVRDRREAMEAAAAGRSTAA
jgi:hypothetical protein